MGWAEHKYLKVDGVNVHYVEAGEGPVVLLLHGLASSLFTWYRNVDTLVSAGYRVVALDLPGHGDSDKPRHLSYDPASGAELVHQFLEAQGIASVAAVGNSAGGLILGLVALAHPDFVQRLVLVASGGLVRGVCWSLRLMSVPGLGELLYRPKLENPLVLSRRIFHQQPDFIEEVLPEMCRVRTLPGSREATIKSVRSSINLFGQRKQRNILHRFKTAFVASVDRMGSRGQHYSGLPCHPGAGNVAQQCSAHPAQLRTLASYGKRPGVQPLAGPVP